VPARWSEPHAGGGPACGGKHIWLLIFWFFCIKTKERKDSIKSFATTTFA
jgi:hypothetical protein